MNAYEASTLVDKSPNVVAAVSTLAIVALIVFPLRAYVRITNKAWGIDDTLMAVALVCYRHSTRQFKTDTTPRVGTFPGPYNIMSWWCISRNWCARRKIG
jgi:hypothetical protein